MIQMNGNRMKEKLIRNDLKSLKRFQGIDESIYYEPLADKIIDLYGINEPEHVEEGKKLGVNILAVFDDHGFVKLSDLEKEIQAGIDFVVFGGDHSLQTIQVVSEATMGIRKYALRGNHDSEYIDMMFKKINAENIHGRVLKTPEGLIIAGMRGSHIYTENRRNRTLLTHHESMVIADSMIRELTRLGRGMDIFFAHDQAFTKTYDPALIYNDGCSHVGLLGNTYLAYYRDDSAGIDPVKYFVHGHLHQKSVRMWLSGQIEMNVYGVQTLSL